METIRFGIIGSGKIAQRFLAGARMIPGVEVIAAGSRNPEHAHQFAAKNNVPVYGTNDEILQLPEVDAVYIATPNNTHFEWVMKALRNGKHVLCEKPMFVTREELAAAFEYSRSHQLMLMEAMKALFLPLTAQIKKLIDGGEIGEIIYMDGKFTGKQELPEGHWALDAISAGAMRDVGVYPIGYFNYLANSKIEEVRTVCRYANGRDTLSQTTIRYQNKILAACTGSTEAKITNKMTIYGTLGYIEAENFWKTGKAIVVKGNDTYELNLPMDSDFKYETEHFVQCIRNGFCESPIMSCRASAEMFKAFESKKIADH